MMNNAGRLLQVNPALCKMLGYSEQELHGRTFADLLTQNAKQSNATGSRGCSEANRNRAAQSGNSYTRTDLRSG